MISEACSGYFILHTLFKNTVIREVVHIAHKSRFTKETPCWPFRSPGKYLWSFVFDFYTTESYLTCLKLKCRIETNLALTN